MSSQAEAHKAAATAYFNHMLSLHAVLTSVMPGRCRAIQGLCMHMAHDDTSRLSCVAVTCLPKARLKVRVLDQCEGGGPYLEAQSLHNCSNSKLCMWQMQNKPPSREQCINCSPSQVDLAHQ